MVGRWSRLVARKFLGWPDAPAGLGWLDVGCGTRALTGTIAAECAPGHLAGIDPSARFLDLARRRLGTSTRLRQADARKLPFSRGRFDRVVSGLVLNFMPDPLRAAAEMVRVASIDGEVALYVWDYAGRMELMRYFWDAATALDPRANELDEGRRFPICRTERLHSLFEAAGVGEVATCAIDIPTRFRDFDDYWTPFLGGGAPAPGYCMSLTEAARIRLRERLRRSLPAGPDGGVHLTARA